jgi:hypothetical protein
MRGDHAAGERNVGKILAVGIELRVWRVGGAGERKFLSAGGRMRGPAR